jgi:hypothetical protein
MPYTHQRFVENAISILLLRANDSFRRFHTASGMKGGSRRDA